MPNYRTPPRAYQQVTLDGRTFSVEKQLIVEDPATARKALERLNSNIDLALSLVPAHAHPHRLPRQERTRRRIHGCPDRARLGVCRVGTTLHRPRPRRGPDVRVLPRLRDRAVSRDRREPVDPAQDRAEATTGASLLRVRSRMEPEAAPAAPVCRSVPRLAG